VHIGVKSAALVAAAFVDFPENKCNFLLKNELDIMTPINNHSEFTVKQGKEYCSWVQFLTGRRHMRSFSPGAVATIALWKSVGAYNK